MAEGMKTASVLCRLKCARWLTIAAASCLFGGAAAFGLAVLAAVVSQTDRLLGTCALLLSWAGVASVVMALMAAIIWLTLAESSRAAACVVIGGLAGLGAWGVHEAGTPREKVTRPYCKNNLHQIGCAIELYRYNYGGFPPFDARGSLYSLALLYPDLVPDARVFLCSDVEKDRPKKASAPHFPSDCRLAGARCDYRCQWSASSTAPANTPIVADMPQNHVTKEYAGCNVLYFDGHVAWKATPLIPRDGTDDVFAPTANNAPGSDALAR